MHTFWADAFRVTCNVQMLQVGALGHQIEQCTVRHCHTVLHLQVGQFRAASRHQLHATIGHATAVAQHDALHFCTGAGSTLAAQSPKDGL